MGYVLLQNMGAEEPYVGDGQGGCDAHLGLDVVQKVHEGEAELGAQPRSLISLESVSLLHDLKTTSAGLVAVHPREARTTESRAAHRRAQVVELARDLI